MKSLENIKMSESINIFKHGLRDYPFLIINNNVGNDKLYISGKLLRGRCIVLYSFNDQLRISYVQLREFIGRNSESKDG